MRFSTQEVSGSRVRLRYSVELDYAVEGPSEFLLNIHAARNRRQAVVEEFFSIDPPRDASLSEDAFTGNRIAAFSALSGSLTVRYAALVEIAHRVVEPADITAAPPSALDAGIAALYLPEPVLPGRPHPAAGVGPIRRASARLRTGSAPFAIGSASRSSSRSAFPAARRRRSIRSATVPGSAATLRTR